MESVAKKKILFRLGSELEGGAEKSLLNLLHHLDYSKYQIDILLSYKSGVYWRQFPKEIRFHYIVKGKDLFSKKLLIRLIQKIMRSLTIHLYRLFPNLLYRYKLKNTSYDVEIAWLHTFIFDMAKSPFKSKKMAWVHIDFAKEHKDKFFREDVLKRLQLVDKIVVVSKQAQDALLSLAPELKRKTQVIYNSIDIKEVIRKAKETHVKKDSKKFNLTAIGRLDSQKGFDRLIKVCHRLKQEDIDYFTLSIVGGGYRTIRNELMRQIKTLGLEDTVKLLGFKENPYPYLQAADIFVLSSRYEGFAYVVLEALILNKPIVSTDVVGPRELLKDGELGLLVENSEEGLYQGLKKMITDKALRESFIQKKKDFSAFEPKSVAREVEKIIDNL